MPLQPRGSKITITNSVGPATFTLLIDAIKYSSETVFFQRPEFSNQLLRTAPEPDGTVPQFSPLLGGRLIQFQSACISVAPRSLATDDSNLDLIFRRWDIQKWEIQGHPSLPAQVDGVYAINQLHKTYLARFEAHQQQVKGFVSYEWLVNTAQVETFSYLTSTTITLAGQSLGDGSPTSVNDIVIETFVPDVDTEEPDGSGSSTILRSFSMVCTQRVNNPADYTSF